MLSGCYYYSEYITLSEQGDQIAKFIRRVASQDMLYGVVSREATQQLFHGADERAFVLFPLS